jgi:hypothetical protein
LIARELGLQSDLVEGDRGEFTVWVGERKVAAKDVDGFPSERDIVAAVRRATAP